MAFIDEMPTTSPAIIILQWSLGVRLFDNLWPSWPTIWPINTDLKQFGGGGGGDGGKGGPLAASSCCQPFGRGWMSFCNRCSSRPKTVKALTRRGTAGLLSTGFRAVGWTSRKEEKAAPHHSLHQGDRQSSSQSVQQLALSHRLLHSLQPTVSASQLCTRLGQGDSVKTHGYPPVSCTCTGLVSHMIVPLRTNQGGHLP